MFASLRRYRMGAGSVDDLMHRVDVDFADALAQQPGFVAYQAVDCGSDELLSITLYRDEAGAAESNELAAEWIRENLGEFELERTSGAGSTSAALFAWAPADFDERPLPVLAGAARARSPPAPAAHDGANLGAVARSEADRTLGLAPSSFRRDPGRGAEGRDDGEQDATPRRRSGSATTP